jgi:hypothetical protein
MSSEIGTVSLSLRLSSGASLAAFEYKITGNGITPKVGTIDVSDGGAASAVVSGIPSGMGYMVEVTAASTDRTTKCSGRATFGIVDGQETQVEVTLACMGTWGTVGILGTFDNCPAVTQIGAVPPVAPVGGTISLVGVTSDLDGDPVCSRWSQQPPVGSFAAIAASKTTFKCLSEGVSTLTLTIWARTGADCDPDASASDQQCARKAALSVFCGVDAADAGGN